MSTVINDHSDILTAATVLPLGATCVSMVLNCSQPVTTAFFGATLFGATMGIIPSRLMNRKRVIHVIQGASAAFALFYKISALLPKDPNAPFPATFYSAALASLVASNAVTFAQELYYLGRNVVLRNVNHFEIRSEVIFV